MLRAILRCAVLGSFALCAAAAGSEAELQGPAILESRCLVCHGAATSMGGLDLTTRSSALRGGSRGPALAPSDPAKSLVLARVLADEMPPGSPLSRADKEALQSWIADGAAWPNPIAARRAGRDWWSLQPLRETQPPISESAPGAWRASPIDRWIFAGLHSAALRPAPEADRRTLIRRVSFGLLGLPPEPEDVEAFVNDTSPDAYERLLDRLLASPHYGERWARHWLDLVRFSESEGFERDLPRDYVWPYRDYVIRSFNADKPYPLFAREQLAGDVIEPVTPDSIVATTLLTLGPVDAVGLTSAISEERTLVREDFLEEMVGTVTQTFLGLTVNCARCHDHKFDPIAQEEYYRMKAAFQAVWPPTRPMTPGAIDVLFPHGTPLLTPAERRSRNQRIAQLEGRSEEIASELGRLYRAARPTESLDGVPRPVARWTFNVDGRADFMPLHLRFEGAAEQAAGRLRQPPDLEPPEKGDATEDPDVRVAVAVSAPLRSEIRAKTLEAWIYVRAAPSESATLMSIRGQRGYRAAPYDGIRFVAKDTPHWENFSVGRFRSADTGGPREELQPGDLIQVAITYAPDGAISIYRNGSLYGEPYTPDAGYPQGRLQVYAPGDALVRFPVTQEFEISEARLYGTVLSEAELAASFRAGVRDWTKAHLRSLMEPSARERIAALELELERLRGERGRIAEPMLVHAATVRALEPTHVLIRGAVDRKGAEVGPAGLSCVAGMPPNLGLPPGASEGQRRQAMANWIAHPDNPLFARVLVNRIWQHHFGQGFVANSSDFGYNGGQPSHPELLDWLAATFVREGWSLKTLHKHVLMSRTYRQSSRFNTPAASQDADNRLLWRFPPRRLTAEEVRDGMLVASGDLNRQLHGPSFRPFKVGVKVGSLRRYDLTAQDTPQMRRRTVYRMNIITGGDPLLEALDCPLPSVKTPQRRSTTTALQALSLMNNAFVQHRARSLATRLRREGPYLDQQIERAFLLAFGRRPEAGELSASRDVAQRDGLESLCWGILNTSEFLYVR